MGFSYYAIYKPYGMISQFSKEGNHPTLGELHTFEKDVYPVGRLDTDSEGLLLLTNDKSVTDRLLNPKHKHARTYLVQVDGDISDDAVDRLRKGVQIRVKKKTHLTAPAKAEKIESPEWLQERNPPVRFRANIPTSWIRLTLTEGKNRQVRRMTAKVGFPTLRLVRESIEEINIRQVLPESVVRLEGI